MVKNLLFFFALLVSMDLSAQKESKTTEQFLEEIDQKVPQLLHDFSIPGAAIAIIENGGIVLQKGYGFADIEKEVKVNTKTGFNIGSISKYDNYGAATDFELFTVQAGAGLHTTLEDFTRFAMASLYRHKDNENYNPVLPTDIIQQMMEPVPPTDGRWRYGLGYQTLHMGASFVFSGHGGANEGWQANFRVDPASNDGFIVLTNGGAGYSICNLLFCEWATWKSGESPWNECHPKLSIGIKLKQIIDDKGIDNVTAAYVALKKEQPDEYDFSESQLNQLGYYYMGKGGLEKAIAIFKINVDAFPYAFNVYDSYGEALLEQGARDEAIENYKKSVQLNPGNENAIKVLNDLGESTEDLIFKVPIEHLKLLEGEYMAANDEDWRIVVEVNNGVLMCDDAKYNYRFTLVPVGDDQFVNPDYGALWRFDTNDQDTKPMMLFGEHKFKKVK